MLLPCVIALASCAQPPLKTKAVYMYKNGYAFVLKEGQVPLTNGNFTIRQKDIPAASFGSIWFNSKNGINHISAHTDTVQTYLYAPGVQAILKANLGRRVSISFIDKKPVISGTIERVFEVPLGQYQPYQNYQQAVALIRTDTGSSLLLASAISSIASLNLEKGAVYDIYERKMERSLTLHSDARNSSTDVSFVYLQRQASWMPSYRLVLGSGTKARLTLGAEIATDGIDMQNASLNLVVGDPTFVYGNQLSSLVSLEGNSYIRDQKESDADGVAEYYDAEAPSIGRSKGAVGNSVVVQQSAAEDFYIYTLKNISLEKNSNNWVKILEMDVNVEHVYTATLPDFSEGSAPNIVDDNEPGDYQSVYHKLRFKNTGDQPLTSAPVFIESAPTEDKETALGQVIMDMVPKGNEAYISLALSMDMPLTFGDLESKRTADAKTTTNRYGNVFHYDLISMKSHFQVENKGDKEVKMQVYRWISGKLGSSDVAWNVQTTKPIPGYYNDRNYVKWEFSLKPGEKRTVNYNFEYLVTAN